MVESPVDSSRENQAHAENPLIPGHLHLNCFHVHFEYCAALAAAEIMCHKTSTSR